MATIRNHGLLDCYDWMKPKPVVLRLAKQIAEENKLLPRSEQRGAGSTDVHSLEKLIRTLVEQREKALKARKWYGPVNHEQAVKYFGAKP